MNNNLQRNVLLKLLIFLFALAQFISASSIASDFDQIPNIDLDDPRPGEIEVVESSDFGLDLKFESKMLMPKKGLLYRIPEKYHNRIIDQVVLEHRQDSDTDHSHITDYKQYDDTPGFTSILFHDPSLATGRRWQYWNVGWSSGKWGAKFAEIRSQNSPEEELLYGFGSVGTCDLNGKGFLREIRPNAIAMVSTGEDPIYIHRLRIQFRPIGANEFIEKIYSPGTVFQPFNVGYMQSYGGGEHTKGKYQGAWTLELWGGSKLHKHSNNIFATGKKIRIILPSNRKFLSLDIACGDAKGFDEAEKQYVRGSGKITVTWFRNGKEHRVLLKDANIGPQAMLRAVTQVENETTIEGDELRISRSGSPVYIMGLRVGLENEK